MSYYQNEPAVMLRPGYVDSNGIRRLFVLAGRNNFMQRVQKNPNIMANINEEIFAVPSYYAFYIEMPDANMKYVHIEKDDTVSLTDIPTFFFDKEYYDGEIDGDFMVANQYENIYKQSSYYNQYGMYKKQLFDSKELKNKMVASKSSVDKTTVSNTEGGCYVATAVYGSYDCPEVWTLRRYRDNTLASTWYGIVFIKTYYAISPTIVKLFGNTKWFKKMWKGKLDHMVNKLQKNGVESTPYKDKNW